MWRIQSYALDVEFLTHLLLVDDECDVITGRHCQHLSFDAQLQSFRRQQRTHVLFGALLFVYPSLTAIRDHLPVTTGTVNKIQTVTFLYEY